MVSSSIIGVAVLGLLALVGLRGSTGNDGSSFIPTSEAIQTKIKDLIDPTTLSNLELIATQKELVSTQKDVVATEITERISFIDQLINQIKGKISQAQKLTLIAEPVITRSKQSVPIGVVFGHNPFTGLLQTLGITSSIAPSTFTEFGGSSLGSALQQDIARFNFQRTEAFSFISQFEDEIALLRTKREGLTV